MENVLILTNLNINYKLRLTFQSIEYSIRKIRNTLLAWKLFSNNKSNKTNIPFSSLTLIYLHAFIKLSKIKKN